MSLAGFEHLAEQATGAVACLREGTEVLRTGGGASLSARQCGVLVDLFDALPVLLRVARAAKQLVDDEESGPGGWGPDVTLLLPLQAALTELDQTTVEDSGGNAVACEGVNGEEG